jgi:FkbM family methyltransferase
MSLLKLAKEYKCKTDNVFEIGVFRPDTCLSIDFMKEGSNVTLFEPQKVYYDMLVKEFGVLENVTIYPYGIHETSGSLKLYIPQQGGDCIESSAFIENTKSPWVQIHNDGPVKVENIEVRTMDEFDDGNIDVLIIDTEGCEWYALEKMKSRPDFIAIEMAHKTKPYVNPNYQKIIDWAKVSGYDRAVDYDDGDLILLK